MWTTEDKINELANFYVREHYKDLSKQIFDNLKIQIEDLIVKAFEDIFGEPINRNIHLLNFNWKDIKANMIQNTIMTSVKSEFEKTYRIKVDEFLKGEEFIDKIVERINKKQLKNN